MRQSKSVPSFPLLRDRPIQRWLYRGLLAIATCCFIVAGWSWKPALAEQALHYTELEFPPLPEVSVPDYERYELDNGLVVYLMENHDLPLVGGSVTVHTGDRLEPADQVGLASVAGDGMRLGGSVQFAADELNQFLEQRAASIETGIGTSSGSASFSALSEDLAAVFERFVDVVRQPSFPEDKLALIKSQMAGSIARRNDSPGDVASREFYKLVYGSDSPYARTVEYSTLANFSRDDVVAFHDRYFQPNNMILSIYGDFDTAAVRSLIDQSLGDWEAPAVPELEAQLGDVKQAHAGGLFLIEQPQLTQSSVLIGHLGGTRKGSDYAALSVMNQVLNGLAGRLMNEVRSRQGLAYSAYAVWSAGYDYPGVFIAGGETRSETTVPFIKSTKAEIAKIREAPITDEELTQAKDSVINSFVFNFQSPSQVVSRLITYEFYDYPQDFILQYRQDVEDTTAADIQQAAQDNLRPEQLVTLVVGNPETMNPPLSDLMPDDAIVTLDITIPQPDA
ncbi:MAG: pitrilysin family protein [Elainellaceae cyanobacterium]